MSTNTDNEEKNKEVKDLKNSNDTPFYKTTGFIIGIICLGILIIFLTVKFWPKSNVVYTVPQHPFVVSSSPIGNDYRNIILSSEGNLVYNP